MSDIGRDVDWDLVAQLEDAERRAMATEWQRAATRCKELLGRANMALLCYTQSHGTPHTELMDEIAEELGLDADGNTLKEGTA